MDGIIFHKGIDNFCTMGRFERIQTWWWMKKELATVIGVATPFLVAVATPFLVATVLWLNQWLIKDTFSFEALFSLVHNPHSVLHLIASLKIIVQETQITFPQKKSCHIRECPCELVGRSHVGAVPLFKHWIFESSMPTTGSDTYSALNRCLLKGKLMNTFVHSLACLFLQQTFIKYRN